MSVDSDTSFSISGSRGDLFAAFIVMREYVKGVEGVSFGDAMIRCWENNKSFSLGEETTTEKIAVFVKSLPDAPSVDVEMSGPWGRYGSIDEVGLMDDIALVVAPTCCIKGGMSEANEVDGEEYSYLFDGEVGGDGEADQYRLAPLLDEKHTTDRFVEEIEEAVKKIVDDAVGWRI